MHSGEVEYAEYLRRHVSLLKGMKASTVVEKALADVSYTEGAVDAIKALKKLGYKTAVISRGPRALADAVKKTLQMVRAEAEARELLWKLSICPSSPTHSVVRLFWCMSGFCLRQRNLRGG